MTFIRIQNAPLENQNNIVSSQAKWQTSKQWLQENKVCQIFRKTNISYHMIRTFSCTRAYKYVYAHVRFLVIIVLRFTLLPSYRRYPNLTAKSHKHIKFVESQQLRNQSAHYRAFPYLSVYYKEYSLFFKLHLNWVNRFWWIFDGHSVLKLSLTK